MTGEWMMTPYGMLAGVTSREWHESGELSGVTLSEKNAVLTHAGELIPIYEPDGMRRKPKRSITFYKNGMVRSVSLQEQQEITTPIGEFPAELVVFHETGELSRFFVTDGQLSGFWSLEDEKNYNVPLCFDLPIARFQAMLTGVAFHRSGAIRSVTLFPDEQIDVLLPQGISLRTRIGFSLYEDGALESAEPSAPTPIDTPVGRIEAYDTMALGVHADLNSLRFDETGRVTALTTATSRLSVFPKEGVPACLSPRIVPSALDPESTELLPLKLSFDYDAGSFTADDGQQRTFRMDDTVVISTFQGEAGGCSPSKCASCSLCAHT